MFETSYKYRTEIAKFFFLQKLYIKLYWEVLLETWWEEIS